MRAKRFRLLTVLLTAVMLVALSLNVFAAQSNTVTQDGLTVQLFTHKDSYKTGEAVNATVRVDNQTGKEVFICTSVSVPSGVTLANEKAVFDAVLQDGEVWTTPDRAVATGGVNAAASAVGTGDNMYAGFWIVLTVFAVCGIIALFVYGKNKKTWLSVLLCMAMVGGLVVAAVPVRAADLSGDIQLSCTIEVDGKDAEVAATVSYVIYDDAEEAAESTETTTPEATEEPTPTPTPEAPTEEPTPTTETPTEEPTPIITTLFETDFEKESVGAVPTVGNDIHMWSQIVENTSKKLFARCETDGEDMVLHIYGDTSGERGGPRVQRNININNLENFTLEFKVKTEGATADIQYVDTAAISLWKGTSVDAWTDVKIEVDLTEKNYTTYVNGEQSGEPKAFSLTDGTTFLTFRFSGGTINPGTGVYFDDIKMWTVSDEPIDITGGLILDGNNGVYWQNVKPTKALSEESLVNNLESHPRIFVSDWEEIYNKLTTSDSEELTIWYNSLKADADSYLNTEPPGYTKSNGRNQLTEARVGRNRIMALSFVYNIEKLAGNTDAHLYLEKAYSDMVTMGEWQDWSAFSAYLATAELMFGYSCGYDWLYNDLTEEQKTVIYDIVKEQAITGLVYNYEGVSTSTTFTTTTHNWNPVCNASAIGVAFAFADEQPLIAEYILEQAPGYIVNCLAPYAPQGGFPEGSMYWGLGTNYLTFAMHLLDNGFTAEYDIYSRYPNWEYAKAEGIEETGAFHIYYNGTTGRFNYGDASSDLVSYCAIYYMADKYDKPEYAWYENKLQRDIGQYLSGYDAIAAICFYNPDKAEASLDDFALDKFYYSDSAVNGIIMRSAWEDDNALYTGMQGGYNTVNHMHLSLGTYVIDYHGKRFVEDIYASNYSLSGARNEIYYKRAEAYNTLVINPSSEGEQNMEGMATVTRYGTSDNTAFGIMNMGNVYNAGSAKVIRAERGIMLTDNRNRVIVQDEVELDKESEFYWFANTASTVRIATDGRSAILEQDGERMLVRIIEGPESAKFSTMERSSLITGVKNTANSGIKLAIHMEGIQNLNLAVEYVGLEAGEGIPAAWQYVPLEQWTVEDEDVEIAELNLQIYADGEEISYFEKERENYALDFQKNVTTPATITVIGVQGIQTNVVQATCIGTYGRESEDNNQDGIPDDTARIVITSNDKLYTYYIKMQYDPFEDALSNTDPGVLYSMKAELEGRQLPEEDQFIKVVDLEASEWGSYPKFGIVDGVINDAIANRWASNAEGCWIKMDFGEAKSLHSMAFAGVTQTSRAYDFDVQVSVDGENWTTVHTAGAETTDDWMYIIDFDTTTYAEALSNVRYVKMLGKGYNDGGGKWNTWAEVRFYESHEKEQADKTYWDAYFITAFEGEIGVERQIIVTGYDYNKNVVDMSGAAMSYEVIDTSIANVSSDGKLIFLKEGATTVIVKASKDGFATSVECDVVCTGEGEAEKYTITFLDHNGNQLSTGEYEAGTAVTPPTVPEKITIGTKEYSFSGWNPIFTGIADKSGEYTAVYGYTSVLFESDFEMETIPEGTAYVSATLNTETEELIYGWTDFDEGNDSYVRVEKSNDGVHKQVLHIYREAYADGSAAGTPRAKRTILIPENADYMTIEFDTWTDGAVNTFFRVGSSKNLFKKTGITQWVHVKIDIDVNAGTFVSYLDNEKNLEGTYDFEGSQTFTFHAGSIKAVAGIFIDNIKMVAIEVPDASDDETEKYTVNFLDWEGNPISGEDYNLSLEKDAVITIPVGPTRDDDEAYNYTFDKWQLKGTEPAVYLTEGTKVTANAEYIAIYTKEELPPTTEEPQEVPILTTDFSTTPVDENDVPELSADGGEWDYVLNETGYYAKIENGGTDESPNPALHLYSDTGNANYPRVDKQIDVSRYSKLIIEYSVKTHGGKSSVIKYRLKSEAAEAEPIMLCVRASKDKWTSMKVEINLEQMISTTYVDGAVLDAYKAVSLPELSEGQTAYIGFETGKLAKDAGVYYDDIKITGIIK